MSQQRINSDRINPEGPSAAMDDYQGIYPYNSYATDTTGQKLSPQNTSVPLSSSPSPRQRFALAVVSLLLWVIVFGLIIWVIQAVPAQIITPSKFPNYPPIIKDNSEWQHFLSQLLFSALAIFSVLIIAINLIYNLAQKRKH